MRVFVRDENDHVIRSVRGDQIEAGVAPASEKATYLLPMGVGLGRAGGSAAEGVHENEVRSDVYRVAIGGDVAAHEVRMGFGSLGRDSLDLPRVVPRGSIGSLGSERERCQQDHGKGRCHVRGLSLESGQRDRLSKTLPLGA